MHERRIYNYRLSRARRIVENALGILAKRFLVFLTPIALEPHKVEKIVMVSCALHNFLRNRPSSRAVYTPPGFNFMDSESDNSHAITTGSWRNEGSGLESFSQQGTNTHSLSSKVIRDEFCHYFNSEEGKVSWQNDMI